MSWDSYIDNLIAQSKDTSGQSHCDQCCIIGLDGGAAWTTAAHGSALKMTPQEAAHIATVMKSGKYDDFYAQGQHVAGQKYQFLRVEDDKVALFKKKGQGAISVQKSKTALVIAHTKEGCQQGNTNKAVGVIADYLESLGM